jgi:hypothetical protein
MGAGMAARFEYVLVNGGAEIHRRAPGEVTSLFAGGQTACGQSINSVEWQAKIITFSGPRCARCCGQMSHKRSKALDALPTLAELVAADPGPSNTRRRRKPAPPPTMPPKPKSARAADTESGAKAGAKDEPRAYGWVLVNTDPVVHRRSPRPVKDPFTGGSTVCGKRIRKVRWQDDWITFSGPRCEECCGHLSAERRAELDELPTLDAIAVVDRSRKYLPRERRYDSYGMRRMWGSFEGGRRR